MQTLYLDTRLVFTDHQGHKCYGNQSDGALTYDTVEKHFSTDIHAFGKREPNNLILVVDKQTSKFLLFTKVKTDMDSTNEDTYGWRYECKTPAATITLLVVND